MLHYRLCLLQCDWQMENIISRSEYSAGQNYITIENCTVEHGTTPFTGGINIYISHGDGIHSKCENQPPTQSIKQPSIVNISNTKVIGNKAILTVGGLGITVYDFCKYYQLNMNGVLFRENSASNNGGNLRVLVYNSAIHCN